MVVTGRLGDDEPRYTLAEAERELALLECRRSGCSPLLHIDTYRADGNVGAYHVECWRCGQKFVACP